MKKQRAGVLEVITTKIIAAGSGAIIGSLIGGVSGAIVGAAYGAAMDDISQRMLSPMEKNRLETIQRLAEDKFNEQIKRGSGLRKDIKQINLKELYEGMLLAARESYEEKKLPLIANLIATAPFTSTPVENLNQTLITAEQLSYQQLCILAVIGLNQWEGELKLSEKSIRNEYKEKFGERTSGVYYDIYTMIAMGILLQLRSKGSNELKPLLAVGDLTPNNLKLGYFGELLFNAMKLDTIDKKDFDEIVKVLKPSV